MTTTTAPLLTYDQVDFDSSGLSWLLVFNWRYTASPFEFLGRSNQLVLLPQTSQGQKWVPIANFDTCMRLLRRMRRDRVMSMALGLEGQVTATAISWTKLLLWDSFDPYLTRLMTVYFPFCEGGKTFWVSRITSEALTLAEALRNVGRRVNLPRLNTQADLLTENLRMCLVDANWQYFDDKVPVVAQTNSQFDDEYRLISYLGVEVAPWLKVSLPGLPLSYNTMPYDP